MRKTLVFTAMLFSALITTAQIDKGKMMSSLGFDYYKNKGVNRFSMGQSNDSELGIHVQHSFLISKSFSIGIGYDFGNNKRYTSFEDGSYNSARSSDHSIQLFTQYFRNINGSRFFFTPRVALFYGGENGYTTDKIPGFNETQFEFKSNAYGINLQPIQFAYRLSNRLMLETGFSSISLRRSHVTNYYPAYTEEGNSTSFEIQISPIVSQIKIAFIY